MRGLFKRDYEEVRAADGVSFSIEEGECVGFLGPNGAGKTTVLKMLSGLLHPTSGDARVLGHVPWKREDALKRQFSLLMGQKNALWWDLPARESLELNRAIYGIEEKRFREVVGALTEMLDVKDKLDVMVRELSLGERMKLELISALLHSPKVLFLDEPTIGLDVTSQQKVRDFLRDYNKGHGIVTMLTSHYMGDIEALCPRVIIIDHGKIFSTARLHASSSATPRTRSSASPSATPRRAISRRSAKSWRRPRTPCASACRAPARRKCAAKCSGAFPSRI